MLLLTDFRVGKPIDRILRSGGWATLKGQNIMRTIERSVFDEDGKQEKYEKHK